MLLLKISKIVKAIRFRYAMLFVLILVVAYLGIINPWMKNWGSTASEQQMILPGDEFYSDLIGYNTQAITIYTSPDVIWQWLVQIGQDRAGFYTYTWLENLIGADIHNANEIMPEWQTLAVGDIWRVVPPEYLGNVGKDAGFRVKIIEPNHALVVDVMGAFVLLPVDENETRLIVRGESSPNNVLMRMVVEPIVFTMMRPMLLGLKARAEGSLVTPVAIMMIAHFGWIIAGFIVAWLYLSERRHRYWLALPVGAALPALLMSGDIQAGIAGFLAVGVTLLGFLYFGKNWFGPILVIASIVLLTLLLAPEAYVAIGFTFGLILLAALGLRVVGHKKSVDDEVQKVGFDKPLKRLVDS